ncbi:Fic/DOC family protein [Prosthecobacter fusiformis]|uniref:Fic/DOC family protein n=1 Tax=Prosthecobacter fusiformis TaxID=48464 RepID=A0A4R7RKX7_9BACT|nr:Fic family protein [Prosthecobacter fusiformis]TDU64083.1 Fic/DOC family protein [Prosthecobacter fusiformis]
MPPPRTFSPIGYQWLADHFQVDPMPHFVESYVSQPGQRITEEKAGRRREVYPQAQVRLHNVFDHLDFALKKEGLHLELLRLILPLLPPGQVADHVKQTPTGKNTRRIAYLYEAFSGEKLPLPDLTTGNYVDLADTSLYFTLPPLKTARWRINENLIGTVHFSPMLRRTPALYPARDKELHARCTELLGDISPLMFQRAQRYLHAKETKTSYAIEHETPDRQRSERFIALLERAGTEDFLTEPGLVRLQNTIVDARYAAKGWRAHQNYVGQTIAPGYETIHFVSPKPGATDLDFLMTQWLQVEWLLTAVGPLPPISAAAIVSWLFVYFHPFEDGNGRIHRFLIHHVLAALEFGPRGMLLPVSAVLLNRPAEYDASLEVFSKPLRSRTEYTQNADGQLTVTNSTLDHFRYIDCTLMAEALYRFIEETIEKELPAELGYLQHYDVARAAMREIVDMPEPAANLFLKLCLENKGHLSRTKRKHAWFQKLRDEEIAALEIAISKAYDTELPGMDTA